MTSPNITRVNLDEISTMGPIFDAGRGDYATACQLAQPQFHCDYDALTQVVSSLQHSCLESAAVVEENIITHHDRLMNAVSVITATEDSCADHLRLPGGHH